MLQQQMIRAVVPPQMRRLIKRMFYRRFKRSIEWEYMPDGWRAQERDPDVKGWNVESILDTYKAKWPAFVSSVEGPSPLGIGHESPSISNDDLGAHNTMMSYGYALALATRHKTTLSMLDWGGGIGHYYLLSKALFPDVTIEYHCKDVPVLIEHGRTLFPEATFSSDDSCLDRQYDFIVASASIHYSQDWKATLTRMARATNGYLFITRMPTVIHAPSFVFVQRPYHFGYNTEYLGWCFNRSEFLSFAKQAGLELVREFIIGERPVIDRAPEQNHYRGYLFKSANAQLTL